MLRNLDDFSASRLQNCVVERRILTSVFFSFSLTLSKRVLRHLKRHLCCPGKPLTASGTARLIRSEVSSFRGRSVGGAADVGGQGEKMGCGRAG